MPEFGIPHRKFIERFDQFSRSHVLLSKEEVRRLAENYDEKFVGAGVEVVVVEKEGNPEIIEAIRYKELRPSEAKRIFYTQRIYSTLFPDNFPRFHNVSSDRINDDETGSPRYRSGSVRQRIRGEIGKSKEEIKHPISSVVKVCEEYGIPLKLDDYHAGNFITSTESSSEFYVDSPTIPMPLTEEHVSAIRKYMDDKEVGKKDRRLVEVSIKRIQELQPSRS